jgi:hypothetical protein
MLVALGAVPAQAQTLDQHQESFDPQESFSVAPDQSFAQTFTAGLTGTLDQVDLAIARFAGPDVGPLTVEIRTVTATGEPSGDVLASTTVAAADVPVGLAFVTVTFPAPANVVANTQYAIVLYTSTFSYGWGFASGNPYGGGALFVSLASPPTTFVETGIDEDAAFRTYVTTLYDLPAVELRGLRTAGRTVAFRLAAPATVRFSLDRRVRRNRFRRVGTFTARARRGRNRVRVPRRLNGRRVGKGVFRLSARAVNGGGRGALSRRVVRLR